MSMIGHFPEIEAAYRRERIIAAYRGTTANPHRHALRWRRRATGVALRQRPLRST